MPFKINISDKGKTLKKETENESLIGKKIGETMKGEDILAELSGYELQITGTSDSTGFPGKKDEEGSGLKRVLLTKGFGMKSKPKGEKKKTKKAGKGLRLKKSVRGNMISKDTIQVNTIVKKQGDKKFEELLPKKQEKKEETGEAKTETKEEKKEGQETKPEEQKAETKEEKKEEKPAEIPVETPAQ